MANTISRTISDDQLSRIIQIESAGNPDAKAPTSSAAGLGQFITATWLGTVQKHRPQLLQSKTREQVAAMRLGIVTAALQLEMLARFTEDNARMLGAGFTDGDLYLAHFLGIGDARKLFRAPPETPASDHVSAAAVTANRSILAGKSCGAVRAWAQSSMLNRWVKAGKPDWVKKWSGVSVPPTKTETGIVAAIAAALAAVGAFIQDNPIVIVGFLVAAVGGFIAWQVWRNRS